MNDLDIEEAKKIATHLFSGKDTRENTWKDLAEYILPSRGHFSTDTNTGKRRNDGLINNVAQRALLKGAAGLTSGLTPTTLPWFVIGFKHKAQQEATGSRMYAQVIEELVGTTLSLGGFYQAIHEFNQDLICFGCALLYCEATVGGAHYEAVPIGTFALATDKERKVDTIVRTISMTYRDLVKQFENASNELGELKEKAKITPFDKLDIIHLVTSREQSQQGEDNLNMPFASYFFIEGAREFLSVSGYNEMPYFFSPWNAGKDVYGIGCGDNALGDQKQIDELEIRKIVGLDKTIDPPMKASSNYKQRLNTFAGAVNAMPNTVNESVQPLYSINFGQTLPYIQEEINKVSARISENLLADIFADIPLSQRPKNISATEWMGRRQERLQLLEPTISNYEPRVLLPLLQRTIFILDRAGELPFPPDSLGESAVLDIEFSSPVAQVMREIRGENSTAFVQQAGAILQLNPESADKVDFDQYLDEIAHAKSVPAGIVRSDDEVQAIREQRAKQQQQQAQAQQEAQMAQMLMQAQSQQQAQQEAQGGEPM